MRDKPAFDEGWVERHPPRPRRHEGLTDGEWAERNRRSERNVRIAFGILFGLVVGLGGVWHWMIARQTLVAAVLVIAGCVILFPALFARKRDQQALEYAGWILLPAWKLLQRLPAWLAATILGAAAILLVVLVVAIAVAAFGDASAASGRR